jgi:hypothetical protein
MNETQNILVNVSAGYDAFINRNQERYESNNNNFIVDFVFEPSSEISAYAYNWIEPKHTIHFRSKAKATELIEVFSLLFDFQIKIIEGSLIITADGHFNPDKFNGRNARWLKPANGVIIHTGFDKISFIELPMNSTIDVISKSFEDLFYKCYDYYFNGRIKEELLLEFGLNAVEVDAFLSIMNKIKYNEETATYINNQFDEATPFEGGMTPSEAVINMIERIKENP